MELFTQLFGDLLAFVYHCFDRIVIYGYLSGLARPEQVVHFFRQVVGVPVVSKEVLSQRTADYQAWVEAFARNQITSRRSAAAQSTRSRRGRSRPHSSRLTGGNTSIRAPSTRASARCFPA